MTQQKKSKTVFKVSDFLVLVFVASQLSQRVHRHRRVERVSPSQRDEVTHFRLDRANTKKIESEAAKLLTPDKKKFDRVETEFLFQMSFIWSRMSFDLTTALTGTKLDAI